MSQIFSAIYQRLWASLIRHGKTLVTSWQQNQRGESSMTNGVSSCQGAWTKDAFHNYKTQIQEICKSLQATWGPKLHCFKSVWIWKKNGAWVWLTPPPKPVTIWDWTEPTIFHTKLWLSCRLQISIVTCIQILAGAFFSEESPKDICHRYLPQYEKTQGMKNTNDHCFVQFYFTSFFSV